jgi:hypothetical protein
MTKKNGFFKKGAFSVTSGANPALLDFLFGFADD